MGGTRPHKSRYFFGWLWWWRFSASSRPASCSPRWPAMTIEIKEATLPPLRSIAAPNRRGAQLDSEHVGDIRGGFGTIFMHDTAPRTGWSRVKTLLAVLGPGVIVMVGDNDAGAVGTYTHGGQQYVHS